MDSSIRKLLWGAFGALTVLVIVELAVTIMLLQIGRRQEYHIVHDSAPLLDAVNTMDDSLTLMISAARGFMLTRQSQFEQQHDDAVRDFERARNNAMAIATDDRDRQYLNEAHQQFNILLPLTEKEIQAAKAQQQDTATVMLIAEKRRTWQPFYDFIRENHRRADAIDLEQLSMHRQELILALLLLSVALIVGAAWAASRIERRLEHSINRQSRRTEAMIGGMSDGVMLVDREGRSVFMNPAGQKLLARSDLGVPIYRQSETYGFRREDGTPVDARELPAAQALATGRPITDVMMFIARGGREKPIAISMSATPLREESETSGVVVTFRDITERRKLEAEMQLQADRAQTLADAGAFFASNIDPVWVTQAIAERVAEVLGDWAAVILRSNNTNELRVASIYHRDMASIGLAWSYIYRQPLVVGEGIIGQVVATGYPSLMQNVGSAAAGLSAQSNETSYHAPSMNLASLLILPLRTRREILGALVIAANEPDRVMSDENLPLAEVLAERAALAIENAKLYTDQVEARRKVEDLSRLKDEFLSIASHELRTPVTSIKGYTQLAKTLIRENDLSTSEEYLDIALDQIDRMSRLILELLDVSRIETGRLEIRREPIVWSTFVRDVVHRHHTAVSDRRFHVDVPDDARMVLGDRDRLEQVLGNLLENAVKYSPDGSDISVRVEDRGDQLVTSVSDRGIGIPLDELGQVFERFHRGRQVSSTNYGGLGLGLYITKQIVERHGGTIMVESKEGSGTTFSFSLPAANVQAQLPAAASAAGR